MDDDRLMARTPTSWWRLLRAPLERRDDPYAGADLPSAQRLVPMLAVLSALLAIAFLPMATPTARGGGGWVVAGLVIAGQLAGAVWLVRSRPGPSFNVLLAFAYAGVAAVALLEWLAGGHSPYMLLFLLWVGAGAGVHPPRRAVPFLAVVLAAGALPLVYGGRGPDVARDVAAESMLWLAIGPGLVLLVSGTPP